MSKYAKAMQKAARERTLIEEAHRENGRPRGVSPDVPAPSEEVATNGWIRRQRLPQRQPSLSHVEQRDKAEQGTTERLDHRLVSLASPISFEAEHYRALRLRIEQEHAAGRLTVIAVSSPHVGDGKTTTAINLAAALAQAPEARVLLIDADLRHPALAQRFGLDDGPPRGLAEAVRYPALSLERLLIRYPSFNLHIIPAGRPQRRPHELLQSSRFGELLATARQLFDYVLLDTPPLIAVPDSRVLANSVDRFLIVVRAHKTPWKMLEEALTLSDPQKVLAIIFNGDDEFGVGYE